MERKIPLDDATADAPRARRHTMIRTKPPTPSPYLDPIVTRRRSGTESESYTKAGPSSADGAVNRQRRVANKQQLESCRPRKDTGFFRHSAGKFSGDNKVNLRRPKTLGSADYEESESADLAYLVVNLQDGLQVAGSSSTAGEIV